MNLSTVFAGQKVGVSQVGEHLWLVSFMDYGLGYFDDDVPLGADREPLLAESVTHVPGMDRT